MKLFYLCLILSLILGCEMTPNVNNRKAGEPWNYYGDLTGLYRDQTHGARPAMVWLDQVQFTRTQRADFQKTLQPILKQGYRKIGLLTVRRRYFVDPFEMRKLAADKGANLVVGCWFAASKNNLPDTPGQLVEYWYQFLYKAPAPTPGSSPTPSPTPSLTPQTTIREPIGAYGD
ncbi:MAG TPA: hypothetical protein VGH07_03380 [Chthoniobacterales bacterium]|jgi:hypothetical protein